MLPLLLSVNNYHLMLQLLPSMSMRGRFGWALESVKLTRLTQISFIFVPGRQFGVSWNECAVRLASIATVRYFPVIAPPSPNQKFISFAKLAQYF